MFESPVLGQSHRWTYRGQIVPTDHQVFVQAEIKACDDRRRRLVADGHLEVDGKIIYQMHDFAIGVSEGQVMKYSTVYIDAIGYEIAPVVVSSLELERRLRDLYSVLHLGEGQLEALTGITERRWWEEGYRISDGAIAAGRRALAASSIGAEQLDVLIYGGVCREYFEPATACRVASVIGVSPEAASTTSATLAWEC